MKSFAKWEAIKFGWEVVKQNFWFVLVISILSGIISYAPSFILNGYSDKNANQFSIIILIISIAVAIIQVIIGIGFLKIILDLTDGKKPPLSEIWLQYPKFISYLLSSILYSFAILGGLLLLIIPGIYIAIRLQFYSYLIIDKNLGPIEALKKSYALTKGNVWNLFLFDGLVFLVTIAGYLLLFVGILITVPLATIATARVYRLLAADTTPAPKTVKK